MRWFAAAGVAAALVISVAPAQQPPKPGPEHELLKEWVGTWDTTMKMAGMESRGSATYKMELGGLWLVSSFEGDLGGAKFYGKGIDTYDPVEKKFVGIWCDSMSTTPMLMKGTQDKATKTLTMSGEGRGFDGKPTPFKAVTEWKDRDTANFSMYVGGGNEPAFTILYKRKR